MSEEDNTLWCGNLPEQATEELLYELFLQAGPLERVRIPKDKDGRQKNFAFVTYSHHVSVPYAIQLFRGTALFHRTLALQFRGRATPLPPPIRSYAPKPLLDFHTHSDVTEQFTSMSDRLKDDNREIQSYVQAQKQAHDLNDIFAVPSLPGDWSHRHHPYRSKERHSYSRDEYSPHHDNRDIRNVKHNSRRRDRRQHKRSNDYYHRD